MTSKRSRTRQSVASAARVNSAATRTTAVETLVLGLIATVATTSAAIGVWSILAFFSALSDKGPVALVAGRAGANR